jgi:type I restriction enzyme M protein
LSEAEEQQIIDIFNEKNAVEDISVVVSYDDIADKNYSLSAGQYFEVKIEYVDITPNEFQDKMKGFEESLSGLFTESKSLEKEIQKNLNALKYE